MIPLLRDHLAFVVKVTAVIAWGCSKDFAATGVPAQAHTGVGIQRLQPADLFDAWMFAEADATLAVAGWRAAPSDEKRDAYAAFVAALDRETQAARVLALRLSFA